MRTLKIDSGNRVFIEGELADLSKLEDKSEFLTSMLALDTELGENMTCGDVIHFFYEAKGLIQKVLSEEYEVVRALVSATQLPREYKAIRVYKMFRLELEEDKEFMYMTPEIEFVKPAPGEMGLKNIAGLPIYIDESIKLVQESSEIEANTKLSLFDLMTCLFDELPSLIKSGDLLLPQ
jgi:hypothetical protein